MMMKIIGILFLVLSLNLTVFGQENYHLIKEGNKLLADKKYGEAEAAYKKVIANSDTIKEAYFNLGNAIYHQGRFEEARESYKKSLPLFSDKKELAEAYHNIGNSFMAEKKWEESIKSFKNALKNNPSDMDTKYNLAYAQEMFKKQQQEEQQNQDQKQEEKDEDKKEEEQKDKKDSEEQKKDEKEKKEDGEKDDQKDGDQEKEEDKGKDKNSENGEPKEGEGEPKPQKLTKEEAERMLRAIEAQEQKLQDKKKQEEMTPVRINTDKDW